MTLLVISISSLDFNCQESIFASIILPFVFLFVYLFVSFFFVCTYGAGGAGRGTELDKLPDKGSQEHGLKYQILV